MFVKDNVTRHANLIGGKIQATIAAMRGGVSEEDARSSARREFMRSGRAEIGVAETSKHVEREVVRSGVKENLMGSGVMETRRGENVNKNHGDTKSFDPVRRRKVSVKEERADHVSKSSYHPFRVPILLRGVGIRKPGNNNFTGEKGEKAVITKLSSIVALKGFDG